MKKKDDLSGHSSALKKILNLKIESEEKPQTAQEVIKEYFKPEKKILKSARKPGRPSVVEEKKAKNITICLNPHYLSFLDRMKVNHSKVKGRGSKVRFIIDQFIELQHRQITQLNTLKEALKAVTARLNEVKGKEIGLRDKSEITKATNQVMILMKILNYNQGQLKRVLPKEEARMVEFCQDWMKSSRSKKNE